MTHSFSIDDVQEFLRLFADLEWAAIQATWLEPDAKAANDAKKAVEDLATFPGLAGTLGRGSTFAAPTREEGEQQLRRYGRRQVFVIRELRVPKHGLLHECTLSPKSEHNLNGQPSPNYGDRMYVGDVRGKLMVISRYAVCVSCDGSGAVWNKPCRDCKGTGWEWAGGVEIDGPVEVIATHRFVPPATERDLADYNREA